MNASNNMLMPDSESKSGINDYIRQLETDNISQNDIVVLAGKYASGLAYTRYIRKFAISIDVPLDECSMLIDRRNIELTVTVNPKNKMLFEKEFINMGRLKMRFIKTSLTGKPLTISIPEKDRVGRVRVQVLFFQNMLVDTTSEEDIVSLLSNVLNRRVKEKYNKTLQNLDN